MKFIKPYLTTIASLILCSLICALIADAVSKDQQSSSCSSGDGCSVPKEEKKYSKSRNLFMKKINEAEQNYEDCPHADCECFQSQIDKDLEPFRDGITKNIFQMTKEAVPRGNHYQIINHRLFRSKNCMFGPRCEGIEHFILKIIDQLPDMEFILNERDYPQIHRQARKKLPVFSFSKDTLGAAPAKEVHFEDHCRYKYLFNFRGVAASFRYKHLFLCRSLVFHVGDEYDEFFYSALKPWIHYIPIDSSLANLQDLIEFVQENDSTARKIAERGFSFIWHHLRQTDVSCYWKKVLVQYSLLIRYQVKRDPSLVAITETNRH